MSATILEQEIEKYRKKGFVVVDQGEEVATLLKETKRSGCAALIFLPLFWIKKKQRIRLTVNKRGKVKVKKL